MFSAGVTTFDRRELAQKVPFPTCITVAARRYRFADVEPQPTGAAVPPGFFNTSYVLDRWRLLIGNGVLAEQGTVYVSVAGSTGITGRYPETPNSQGC